MRQVVIKIKWKYADVAMTLLAMRDFGLGRDFKVLDIFSILSKTGGPSRVHLTE